MNFLRKFILGLIVLCVALSMLPPAALAATEIASGTCGDNLTWMLDSDGLLTISGSGKMEGIGPRSAPWYTYFQYIRTVSISDGITNIDHAAFYDCINLTNIDIPKSVTSIGMYAFYNCPLTSITIPQHVTAIDTAAFYECKNLTSVIYLGTLSQWLNVDFSDSDSNPCSNGAKLYLGDTLVDELIIPNEITRINEYVFDGCTSIKSIVIPDSVVAIGRNAFNRCANLTNVTYKGSLQQWYNINFGYGGNPCNNGAELYFGDMLVDELTIPDGITCINENVFAGCTSIKSVVLPQSVTTIGDNAFLDCVNLTDIDLPDRLAEIGTNAFCGCSSLEHVVIPDGTTSIGNGAFARCNRLASISFHDRITSIGVRAFSGCEALTDVYYSGTNAMWNSIAISEGNEAITNATIHFLASGEGTQTPDDEPQPGDGWGDWSDYVDVNTIVIYPVDDGNLYFGQESFWSGSQKNTEIRLLSADSTITNATIPSVVNGLSVTGISSAAFSDCAYLMSVHIPASVQVIGDWPFTRCSSLTAITVETGNPTYFSADGALYSTDGEYTSLLVYPVGKLDSSFQIHEGTTRIEYYAFSGSANLVNITIPKSITYIGECAFEDCSNLSDIYYTGTAEQWHKINIRCDDPAFLNATIHYDSTGSSNTPEGKLVVYSDYTNLSISTGSTLTLSAGIQLNGELLDDPSGITFQIADTSILEVIDTGISSNCRYVKLKGLRNGTTAVAFTDATTGKTITIPVTVFENYHHSYTLSNVPEQQIEKYPTNFYNVNGLYVDSYQYTVNEDGSSIVSFDVYNTNYIYCTVEVFDQDGNLERVVLIDKMTSSNTSVKEAVWDNMGYLIRDFFDGDLLTYRQESGYSKHTPVTIEIPKNGYLKICTDPEESLIVGLVNAADIIIQLNKIAGKITDYGIDSKDFAENLTTKLLSDKLYAQYLVDGSKFPQELMKNIGKETLMTATSMGDFADTIAHNLGELNLAEIIADTALDCGFGIAEEAFTDATGWIGDVLEILFVAGKAENVIIQHSDYSHAQGTGSIYIQNQGGGLRASQQITVECENELDSDTALNVFTVTIDPALVEAIKETNPDLYEAFVNGVTHTYNISLLQNGEEVQPDGKVTVYIPIPEDMRILAYTGQVKIYRTEENGTVTEMNVSIQDNCFVFETDHFSLYTLVGYAPKQDPLPPVDDESDSTDENDNTTEEKVPPVTDNKNKNSTNMWIVVLIIAAVVVFTVLMIPVFKKKKA